MSQITRVVFLLLLVTQYGESTLFDYLLRSPATPYSRGSLLDSFASHVPGSSINSISEGPPVGSNLAPPQPPQVLLNHMGPNPPLDLTPPPAAARPSSPVDSFMSLMNKLESRGQGHTKGQTAGSTQVSRRMLPMTGKLKQMVTKWATHLGHKAWYEAHGCVDPASTLHGKNGRLANVAMMMGCSSPDAAQYCELSQMAVGGAQAARSRMFMELIMPKHLMDQFQQCLTPTTLMNSMSAMFGGGASYNQHSYGVPPPPGSTAYQQKPDCAQVSPMLMMGSVGGGEGGMIGPEAFENIGRMRNRYLKMTCQENIIMGSLPYRLCCPGQVTPPSMQEAMMVKSMGGA